MSIKVFLSERKFNQAVNDKIREIVQKYNEGIIAKAVYYDDLVEENKKLKTQLEQQDVLLKAIRIVRDFINE